MSFLAKFINKKIKNSRLKIKKYDLFVLNT